MARSRQACTLSNRAASVAGGAAEVHDSSSRRANSRRRRNFTGIGFVPFILSLALLLRLFAAPTAVVALLLVPSALRQHRAMRSMGDSPAMHGKLNQEPGAGMGEKINQNAMVALSSPVLELITPNGCASSGDPAFLIQNVEKAVAGGVSLVQLRDYDSDSKSKTELAQRLRSATDGRAMLVLNGEPDAARACGADGVHLPERMVDRLVGLQGEGGWPRVVGCSVHSVAAAVEAARLGATYVQVRNTRMVSVCWVYLIHIAASTRTC